MLNFHPPNLPFSLYDVIFFLIFFLFTILIFFFLKGGRFFTLATLKIP